MTISPLIDLKDLSSVDRPAAWSKVIRDNHFGLDITFKGQKPAGKLAFARFGETKISAISSVTQYHQRTPALMADKASHLFAVIQIDGSMTLNQSGREQTLRPGSVAVYDTAVPYEAAFVKDEHKLFCIQVPRMRFDLLFTGKGDYLNVVLDEPHGGPVIASYFRDFSRRFKDLPEAHRAKMVDSGIEFTIKALAGRLGLDI